LSVELELELVQGQLTVEDSTFNCWKVAVPNKSSLKRYSESYLEVWSQRLAGARVGSRVEVIYNLCKTLPPANFWLRIPHQALYRQFSVWLINGMPFYCFQRGKFTLNLLRLGQELTG
jgi:hypothetical protein